MPLKVFFSVLSIVTGFSGCIAFFIMKNYQASVWGFIMGVLALLIFHIHRLKKFDLIADYYTTSALWSLGWLGYAGFAIGLSCFIYNMIMFICLKTPLLPVEGSNFISAVWCALGAKTGFILFYYARQYSRYVETVPRRVPLLPRRTQA